MTIEFIPSEERTLLRDSVRRTLETGSLTWAQCAEMGWLMAGVPETAGGFGGNAYDLAIIAEEFGRATVTEPFIETAGVAIPALLALAPEDTRIAAIAVGDLRVALAHDETGMGGDAKPLAAQAEPTGDGFVISARKVAVVGAPEADLLLVSAMIPSVGISLFAVRPTPEMLKAHETIDGRTAATIILDRVIVTPDALIGTAGNAGGAVRLALDHALILGSADALGAMQAALDLTRDYLLTRRQYGRSIGDFQALRHRLADMFIETEQARSMVFRGLEALVEADEVTRTRLASATKARVAKAGRFVTGEAIQLHGGIGVAEEYPLGRLFRRLLAFDLRHGASAAHIDRFARLRPQGIKRGPTSGTLESQFVHAREKLSVAGEASARS